MQLDTSNQHESARKGPRRDHLPLTIIYVCSSLVLPLLGFHGILSMFNAPCFSADQDEVVIEEVPLSKADALRLLQASQLKALRQMTGATIEVSVVPSVLRLAGNRGMLEIIKKPGRLGNAFCGKARHDIIWAVRFKSTGLNIRKRLYVS